jgi:hypothetical protein
MTYLETHLLELSLIDAKRRRDGIIDGAGPHGKWG